MVTASSPSLAKADNSREAGWLECYELWHVRYRDLRSARSRCACWLARPAQDMGVGRNEFQWRIGEPVDLVDAETRRTDGRTAVTGEVTTAAQHPPHRGGHVLKTPHPPI